MMNPKLKSRALALADRLKQHERETAQLNYEIGELHSDIVDHEMISGIRAGEILKPILGISGRSSETYGRISRRIPKSKRPVDILWTTQLHLITELNPANFSVTEEEFVRAILKVFSEIEGEGLTPADLKRKDQETGEAYGFSMVRKHLKH